MTHSRRASYEGIGAESCGGTALFSGLSLRNVECPACGHTFGEGDSIVLYVVRPAGRTRFEVGRAVCDDDAHPLRTEFTLGAEELLIAGRVGVCSDVVTQSSWRVLVAPRIVGVSEAASKALTKPCTDERDDKPTTTSPRHVGLAMVNTRTEGER